MTPTEERTQLFRSLCEMERYPPDEFNKMRVEALRYSANRLVREEKATLELRRRTA